MKKKKRKPHKTTCLEPYKSELQNTKTSPRANTKTQEPVGFIGSAL